MKKLLIPAACLWALSVTAMAPVAAHPGGTDPSGCHLNRKTGERHCHRPANDPADANLVKKSRSGICHDRTSPNYFQLKYYETFPTLQKCLDSGGRERR